MPTNWWGEWDGKKEWIWVTTRIWSVWSSLSTNNTAVVSSNDLVDDHVSSFFHTHFECSPQTASCSPSLTFFFLHFHVFRWFHPSFVQQQQQQSNGENFIVIARAPATASLSSREICRREVREIKYNWNKWNIRCRRRLHAPRSATNKSRIGRRESEERDGNWLRNEFEAFSMLNWIISNWRSPLRLMLWDYIEQRDDLKSN